MSSLFTYPFTSTGVFNPIVQNSNVRNLSLGSGNLAFPLQVVEDGVGIVLVVPTNSISTTPAETNSYFSISFNVEPRFIFNITSLTFYVGKGGLADPRGYVIKSNIDNYTSVLGGNELPTGPQELPVFTTVNISTLNNLQQLTLRFYVYTPSQGRSVDFSNITVNGTIRQIQPASTQISMQQIIGGLYSDNARVYYKPHSLASCGVGTVKNSRHTAKKT